MEILNFMPSTALRLVDTTVPNTVFLPEMAKVVEERYHFVEAPKVAADYTSMDGLIFRHGYFNGHIITKFQLYPSGFIAEGETATEVLDGLITDVVNMIGERYGHQASDQEGMARLFRSQLEVKPSSDILERITKLSTLADRLTGLVREYGLEISPYKLTSIGMSAEGERGPGRFVFERRAGKPISDGVFFTDAPISSSQHIALLRELEALL
jgi:hypothetical protein